MKPLLSPILDGMSLGATWLVSRLTRISLLLAWLWLVNLFLDGKHNKGEPSVFDATLTTVTLGDFLFSLFVWTVFASVLFSPDVKHTNR